MWWKNGLAASCIRTTQYLQMWVPLLCSCKCLLLLLQPSCMHCILTLIIFRVEQCLRRVRRGLLALQRTALHQGRSQTEEGLVVPKGVQTSRGRDHRITEDRVWEDRIKSEWGAKKWLLDGGFRVVCGNNSCWVSGRFDWRNLFRLYVTGVQFWLLLIGCLLLIIALFWILDSLDGNSAVAVHTGASGRSLCCGNDAAGSGETIWRSGPFQSPLFSHRGGEAVKAARHWGRLALNIQHCDRWTNCGSGILSFARARFWIHRVELWVNFDCAPWIRWAPHHFASWPPSDALCAPREPEVLGEPRIFLFWCKLVIWTLTAGDGHGGSLFILLQLQWVLGRGGITGWLVGGGGAAWWRLLYRAAAVWPRLIFQTQAELTTALTLGSTLDAIQPWKRLKFFKIVFLMTNRRQQSLFKTVGLYSPQRD